MKFSDIKKGMKLKLIDKLGGKYYDLYDVGDIVIVTEKGNETGLKTFPIQRLKDKKEGYLIPDNHLVNCWEMVQLSLKELME